MQKMAHGCECDVSVQFSNHVPKILMFDSFNPGNDWEKLENLVYDGKRLK